MGNDGIALRVCEDASDKRDADDNHLDGGATAHTDADGGGGAPVQPRP